GRVWCARQVQSPTTIVLRLPCVANAGSATAWDHTSFNDPQSIDPPTTSASVRCCPMSHRPPAGTAASCGAAPPLPSPSAPPSPSALPSACAPGSASAPGADVAAVGAVVDDAEAAGSEASGDASSPPDEHPASAAPDISTAPTAANSP